VNVKVNESFSALAQIYRFLATDAIKECVHDSGFTPTAPARQREAHTLRRYKPKDTIN